ncbi:MAG: hypothetical protein N3D82_00530 [Ignisphaera sp.]|nr:hypothetical protein [Ignisphaera sp.]
MDAVSSGSHLRIRKFEFGIALALIEVYGEISNHIERNVFTK